MKRILGVLSIVVLFVVLFAACSSNPTAVESIKFEDTIFSKISSDAFTNMSYGVIHNEILEVVFEQIPCEEGAVSHEQFVQAFKNATNTVFATHEIEVAVVDRDIEYILQVLESYKQAGIIDFRKRTTISTSSFLQEAQASGVFTTDDLAIIEDALLELTDDPNKSDLISDSQLFQEASTRRFGPTFAADAYDIMHHSHLFWTTRAAANKEGDDGSEDPPEDPIGPERRNIFNDFLGTIGGFLVDPLLPLITGPAASMAFVEAPSSGSESGGYNGGGGSSGGGGASGGW